jgi:hypothetical protein
MEEKDDLHLKSLDDTASVSSNTVRWFIHFVLFLFDLI